MARERAWASLWLAWALGGLVTAAAILVAVWAGWDAPQGVWWWWAAIGAAIAAPLEVLALLDRKRSNTLSENVWSLEGGWRSLIVTVCLWGAWLVATGIAWPSALVAFLLWCSWHFMFDGPGAVAR